MLERLPLWCFRLALITTTLNSIAVMAALSHRFGLVSDGQGGYFVVNTYLVAAALGFSLLALLFSIISRRHSPHPPGRAAPTPAVTDRAGA